MTKKFIDYLKELDKKVILISLTYDRDWWEYKKIEDV